MILELIEHPNHGGILLACVDYKAGGSLNREKWLSSVLFSLKMVLTSPPDLARHAHYASMRQIASDIIMGVL